MLLDWSIKTQHTGLKMGFGNLACLFTGAAAAGSVLTSYNKPFPIPYKYTCVRTLPPPSVALYINIMYTHTHTSSLFKSSFSSSAAAVTGALRMGRVCDTHIDRSVTDKELGDERVTGLPHNDR